MRKQTKPFRFEWDFKKQYRIAKKNNSPLLNSMNTERSEADIYEQVQQQLERCYDVLEREIRRINNERQIMKHREETFEAERARLQQQANDWKYVAERLEHELAEWRKLRPDREICDHSGLQRPPLEEDSPLLDSPCISLKNKVTRLKVAHFPSREINDEHFPQCGSERRATCSLETSQRDGDTHGHPVSSLTEARMRQLNYLQYMRSRKNQQYTVQ